MASPLPSKCCSAITCARAGSYMNVVTHGSPVRRRIVCSKHCDIGSFSRSSVEKRNKLGLRVVILTEVRKERNFGGTFHRPMIN